MKRFFLRSALLTVVFLVLGYLIYTRLIPNEFTWSLPGLLVFVFVATNIVYAWLFTSFEKNNHRFTSTYLAVNMLKMFIYLLVVVGWVWFEREHAKAMLGSFLIMYIGYTVLEVTELVRLVQKK